jgi:hypothetical protein
MDDYQQLRSDLWDLLDEIEQLRNKSNESYNKHPNDLVDLGERQAFDICHKKLIELLEK